MDDIKPKTEAVVPVVEKVEEKPELPKVTEHPISETEAKKFAGQGDFEMPVSPLDELIGGTQKANKPAPEVPVEGPGVAAKANQPIKEMQATQVTPTTPPPAPVTPPPAPVVPPPVTPKPAAMPIPREASTKELEQKAKAMLTETKTTNSGPGVKKKAKSGTAMSMALAAVIVVMMGAGGVVGMNLLKMNQVAENRSQAACPVDESCTLGAKMCQGEGGSLTGYECTCVDLSNNECPSTEVWSCGAYNSSVCPPANIDPGGVGCTENDPQKCCSSNTCTLGSLYPDKCFVSHFFSPDNDTDRVVVTNCHAQPNEGNVQTLACAVASASFQKDCGAEQIDIYCPTTGKSAQISRRYPDDCGAAPPPTEPPTTNPLMCTGLSSNAGTAPKIGQTVTLTCAHDGDGFSTYNYRYKIGDGDYSLPVTTNTLTIESAGTYTVQCQACKADGSCTAWGVGTIQ